MAHVNGSGGKTWERPDAPLGTLVYRAGLLSKEKLETALAEGGRSGRRLGAILLQKGWIEEDDLARLLAGQKGLAFVSLKGRGFDPAAAQLLGERLSRFHCALPIEEDTEAGAVVVAIADPTDDAAVSDIGAALRSEFQLVVATAGEIRTALDDVFAPTVVAAVAPPPLTLAGTPDASAGTADSGLRLASPSAPADLPAPRPDEDTQPPSAAPVAAPAADPACTPAPHPAQEGHPAPAEPEPPAEMEERELPFRVVIVVEGEEDVEVGGYADEAAAESAARDLVAGLVRREEWPRVGRRFIRPERIVSVDIRERLSWTGSRGRAAWGGQSASGEAADGSQPDGFVL